MKRPRAKRTGRGLRGAFVLALSAACASPKAPETPAAPDRATSLPAAAPGSTAAPPAEAPADQRTVRCGVDDAPIDVQGNGSAPGPTVPDERDEKSRLGFSAGREIRARLAPPGALTMGAFPDNAAVDPGSSTFTVQTLTRDDRPIDASDALEGPLDAAAAVRRHDVTPCALGPASQGTELAIEVRLSALGVPYAATARAPSLSDGQSRCLAELGCRLSLAPREKPTLLVLRGPVAFTPPELVGEVRLSTRIVTTAEGNQARAVAKWEAALSPIAQRCAAKSPPVESFSTIFTVRMGEHGRASTPQGASTGAAGAIVGCLGGELAGIETALRAIPATSLLTTWLTFERVVHFPKTGPTPSKATGPKPPKR